MATSDNQTTSQPETSSNNFTGNSNWAFQDSQLQSSEGNTLDESSNLSGGSSDPFSGGDTESDNKAVADGLYITAPILNKITDIKKNRKLFEKEMPIMLIADIIREIIINNFLPFLSANIPMGTPNIIGITPFTVKRIPTDATPRPAT